MMLLILLMLLLLPLIMNARIIQVHGSHFRASFSIQLSSAETPTMTLDSLQDFVQHTHALAFFPRAALLNHSCDPCCSVFYGAGPGGRLAAHVVRSAPSCRTFAAARDFDFAMFI